MYSGLGGEKRLGEHMANDQISREEQLVKLRNLESWSGRVKTDANLYGWLWQVLCHPRRMSAVRQDAEKADCGMFGPLDKNNKRNYKILHNSPLREKKTTESRKSAAKGKSIFLPPFFFFFFFSPLASQHDFVSASSLRAFERWKVEAIALKSSSSQN